MKTDFLDKFLTRTHHRKTYTLFNISHVTIIIFGEGKVINYLNVLLFKKINKIKIDLKNKKR